MTRSTSDRHDFAALLPGVGVFGGVRRFIEVGNEMVRRGHRFVIYHPGGEAPGWLPFLGETRPLSALANARHEILICNNPPQLPAFEAARADLKLFYFALEGIPGERRIARDSRWTVAVNSTGLHDRLRRRYGVRAEKAIGGVDLATFHPAAAVRAPASVYRVLAFGRFSRRRKGTAIVLRAVEQFAKGIGRDRVQLVLFDHADGDADRGSDRSIPGAPPIEYHMNLSQPALAELYASCDAFVSAERRAGWSNTVAEAMACGLPVVCTRSGTLDVAEHGRTAYVVRWRHPWFLARGLAALHGDAAMGETFRTAALRRIRDFSWSHVADQMEDIVRRRLGSTR